MSTPIPAFARPQIHQFTVNGRHFVLDVNSGALHVLDDAARTVLANPSFQALAQAIGPASEPGAGPAVEYGEPGEELLALVRRGQLFSRGAMPLSLPARQTPTLKALCLHVAHDCNLRCEYCFAKKGNFGGDRGLMSVEVGERAIDLLIGRSGSRRRLAVDFFGGEPLLNFPVVRHLADYAAKRGEETGKEFTFTLTTNALALSGEIARYLAERDWNVVLSLDGRSEVHDRLRPLPANGGGSYARVLPNILSFIKSRGGRGYYLRGTFTHYNLDFLSDVQHLLELGINEISLEPVVSKDVDWAIEPGDVPALLAEYDRLAAFYLDRAREGRPFTFFHFNLNLFHAPCLAKRLTGCGAGYEYLAVTPEGKLYPCHQFVGRPEYLMGDVFHDSLDAAIVDRFSHADVTQKPACQACWARFHCSGGCQANAELFNGDILEPYDIGCELQRKRIECALAVQAELALAATEEGVSA